MATIVTVSMANANKNNNKRKQQKKQKSRRDTRMPSITCAIIAGQVANRVAWQSE
jgi:hypothetical protein